MASRSVIADAFRSVAKDIDEGGHNEYWLKGGRGSTKSSFISIVIALGLYEDKDANALIYRRVSNTIKDSVFAQMVWAIETLGMSSVYRLQRSPFEIINKRTGQRIIFRGADDPMKSKSIKLTHGYFKYLWFEELAEFRSMEDIRVIQQSAFRGTDKAFTLYSYNPPKSANAWVNSEALRHAPDRLIHSSSYLDVPREWLGEAFITRAEALRESNPLAYQNEYLGDVTGNGGNVFENVRVREITDTEIASMEWFYQGIDWGWFPDPFHWTRCAFDAKKRVLYIVDEYRANKKSNRECFEAIKSKLTQDESLIADSAEPKSVGDFRDYGAFWIRGANKGAVGGKGSVAYSIKWLASLTEIVIDAARCPHTAKEFMGYEYERNAAGEFVGGFVDAENHCLTGDTVVDTIDGGAKIRDMVGRSGKVYCYDEAAGRATVSTYRDVRCTGVEDILEIETDDGGVIRCSPEHLILTQRGWVLAVEITEKDSILKIQL